MKRNPRMRYSPIRLITGIFLAIMLSIVIGLAFASHVLAGGKDVLNRSDLNNFLVDCSGLSQDHYFLEKHCTLYINTSVKCSSDLASITFGDKRELSCR